MSDILAAIGLVLVIEGVLWALFPGFGMAILEAASELPEATLRTSGAVAVGIGFLIFWLVRG
jgi:hypothetical protein